MSPPVRAILLVGPTGSGKSPVGMLLEQRGGFRHFDFGVELRAAAEGRRGLSDADAGYVRRLLEAHALLPDDRFAIAERLLAAFLERAGFDPAREWLVLNGLPRHVGQARALAPLARVELVVVLECDARAACERVARRRRGEGLDHAGRDDDSPDAVARKLAVYAREAQPLIAWFEANPSARVRRIRVTEETREEAVAAELRAALGPGRLAPA